MGRFDLDTRFYLADMLTGFRNGDWRAVAEIHFRMGFVPPHKSMALFTQACRSIGEPLIDKPLHEVSVARLLGQVLRIAVTFAMRAQPQLLLLHKTRSEERRGGKSGSVRLDLGGRRLIKNKNDNQ